MSTPINRRKFISEPNVIPVMDGNSVDFSKTFDLSGQSNDEMLRLYLREAGLSDRIEYLTPEQRKAFIYDIIKSNSDPGKWKPSTMETVFDMKSSPDNLHLRTDGTCSSKPLLIKKKKKGSKPLITEPINFQHINGDMARDMTKNAFDLTKKNDNVLKKYMMERGIDEDDIANIDKEEIIKKIIQSEFKWIPGKCITNQTATTSMSNFERLCHQFPDLSEFPSPESLYCSSDNQSDEYISEIPRLQADILSAKPIPPPRKPHTAPCTTLHPSTRDSLAVQSEQSPLVDSPPQPPPMPSILHGLQDKIHFVGTNAEKSELPQIQKETARETLLAAIRNGVTLKKVSTESTVRSSISSTKPKIKTFLILHCSSNNEPSETDV